MGLDLQWKLLPGNTHIYHSGSFGTSVLFEQTPYLYHLNAYTTSARQLSSTAYIPSVPVDHMIVYVNLCTFIIFIVLHLIYVAGWGAQVH